jgi:hypothetical protein
MVPKDEIESWLNQQMIFPAEISQGIGPGEAFIMFHRNALTIDA